MPQSSSVRVLILILLIATFLAPRTRGETTVHDYRTWGAVADTLRGVQMGRRTALANAFVQVGSDSVYVNQTRLSRDQYRINYHMGTIRIDAPMPPQAIVIVYYQRQPVLLNPVYSLRPIEVSDPEAALQVPPQRVQSPEREIDETPRNLVFGGSKSVSFSVGSNRGSSLDQDLQATIEGQITPTIRVRALLSDNNLPIQPQGNTEELQYFDQVFVEIEGTQARATMGDFAFANNISTYSPITRQLRGASVSAWKGGTGRLSASGATSKGIFRSVQFRGVTGLQGPYELLSAARINQEVIIAGTEVVYADGVEMRRGQNQDYVIDYDRGTVTFSPRRLITRDTEIAVDFEVTQESYIRTALFATGEEVRITAGAHLDLLFAQESDDKDDPTNTSFSVEDIEALANAGDNSDAAITGGVTQVPPGEGQYVLVPPDTVVGTQEFFVFNDSIGDYNVQFVEVEPRTGDYVLGGISRTGQRYFEFVSDGSGTYTVGRQLPLPERKQLLTARFRRTDMRHLTFDFEWNVSNYDRNLFSTIDDDDNVGQAGRAKIGIGNIPLGRGVLALTGRVSSLEEEFSSFDRARPQ